MAIFVVILRCSEEWGVESLSVASSLPNASKSAGRAGAYHVTAHGRNRHRVVSSETLDPSGVMRMSDYVGYGQLSRYIHMADRKRFEGTDRSLQDPRAWRSSTIAGITARTSPPMSGTENQRSTVAEEACSAARIFWPLN